MNILQLHYTSCRHGTGQPGFQIRAMSEGIQVLEQREIVSRSGYRRPLPQKSAGHKTAVYPVACRYYRLSSGRYAVTRINYTGTDYSGREGNFFAHTLILPADDNRYPTDYFAWSGWKSGLEAGEDNAPPPPLPPIDHNEIPLSSVSPFDTEHDARLQAMIRAVFLSPLKGRTLVLRTAPDAALSWIAALHRCFPLAVAKQLEFSSYEYTPNRLLLISATVAGTEFTLDQTQRQYQFYVFDDQTGADSMVADGPEELPAAAADYAQLVLFLAKQHRLEQFFDFTRRIECTAADSALGQAACAYGFSMAEMSASDESLRVVANFAMQHENIYRESEVAGPLCRHLKHLAEKGSFGDWQLYIRFLTTGATATNSALDDPDILAAWGDMLLAGLRETVSIPVLEEEEAPFSELKPQMNTMLTSPRFISKVSGCIQQFSPQAALYIIKRLAKIFADNTGAPGLQQANLQQLIQSALFTESGIYNVLPGLLAEAETPQLFCHLCGLANVQVLKAEKTEELLGEIINQRFSTNTEFKWKARQCLPPGCIAADLAYALKTASNRVTVYLEYHAKVISQRPDVKWTHYQHIFTALLSQSDARDRIKLSENVLAYGDLKHLENSDTALAQRCVTLLNDHISLNLNTPIIIFGLGSIVSAYFNAAALFLRSNNQDDKHLSKLRQLAQLNIKPNRALIRYVLEKPDSLFDTTDFSLLSTVKPHIQALNSEGYQYAARVLLDYVASTDVFEPARHKAVLKLLSNTEKTHFADLQKIYIKWLNTTVSRFQAKRLDDFICILFNRNDSELDTLFLKQSYQKYAPIILKIINTEYGSTKRCIDKLGSKITDKERKLITHLSTLKKDVPKKQQTSNKFTGFFVKLFKKIMQ